MVVHESRREWRVVRERAEAEIQLSTEYGLPLWHAWGTIFLGRALAEGDDCSSAITTMHAAIDEFEAIRSQLLRPYCLALMAEAYRRAQRPEAGLALLDEGLQRMARSGERFYEAELHRLKGELLLAANGAAAGTPVEEQAESHFRTALDVARQQDARLLELRAATSLARFSASHRRFADARGRLADVYEWFNEGMVTADLVEARSLLDEPGASTEDMT